MKFLWPDIENANDAHKACASAAGIAFFVAAATGLLTWLQTSGKINLFPGIDNTAYLDVVLFTIIGAGLCLHSRIAAVAGLLLYIAERVFMIQSYGFNAGQVAGILIFGLSFVNGVRGSFAWHVYKKSQKAEAASGAVSGSVASSPARRSLTRPLFLILLLAIVASVALYYLKTNREASKFYNELNQKAKPMVASVASKIPKPAQVAPEGPKVKLMLKSGRSFEGVVVRKNREGQWLFIDGVGEVFFSVREIAEAP